MVLHLAKGMNAPFLCKCGFNSSYVLLSRDVSCVKLISFNQQECLLARNIYSVKTLKDFSNSYYFSQF